MIKVWSLLRGRIEPPEPLSEHQERLAERESCEIQQERDKRLTIEQIWREQGTQEGYRRKGVKRVEAQKRRMA